METLAANLYAHESYSVDQGAHLIFELTNHSKKPVHILKWNTPLEGLKSDCLNVTKNGRAVEYDGRMVKRGNPQPDDFETIQPGKSVTAKVDISTAYNVSHAAKIKVNYKPEKLTYFTEEPTTDFLMAAIAKMPKQKKIQIISRPASFSMKSAGAKKITEGEQARKTHGILNTATSKKKAAGGRATKNNTGVAEGEMSMSPRLAKACRIKGGTAAQIAIVKTAHQHGYELAKAAFTAMEKKNAAFNSWFGKYSSVHFARVKLDFRKIRDDFQNKRFTYDLSGYKCARGDYAYTYKRTATIWLCSSFWSAPPTGADSQAGTLIHEHSHASASTDDNAYGEILCKKLALDNSAKAVKNADSHEFFAKG